MTIILSGCRSSLLQLLVAPWRVMCDDRTPSAMRTHAYCSGEYRSTGVALPQGRARSTSTFELGPVLGGTVSAGAYTAGALDYLLEALEAWHDTADPLHRVVIKMAAG